jgi:hypothetical protein
MDAQEVRRLLTRQTRRGLVLFGAGFWLLLAAGVLLLMVRHAYDLSLAWAPGLLAGAVLTRLALLQVRRRHVLGCWIAENPGLVYWAHASWEGLLRDESPETCRELSLHLRTGPQLAINLSPPDMARFVVWLRSQSPAMRWGTYE